MKKMSVSGKGQRFRGLRSSRGGSLKLRIRCSWAARWSVSCGQGLEGGHGGIRSIPLSAECESSTVIPLHTDSCTSTHTHTCIKVPGFWGGFGNCLDVLSIAKGRPSCKTHLTPFHPGQPLTTAPYKETWSWSLTRSPRWDCMGMFCREAYTWHNDKNYLREECIRYVLWLFGFVNVPFTTMDEAGTFDLYWSQPLDGDQDALAFAFGELSCRPSLQTVRRSGSNIFVQNWTSNIQGEGCGQ